MTAGEIITELGLAPHPEGGWYRQTWIATAEGDARAPGTCIYYLLQSGERSQWHRVDATEIWHFYAGAPLRLRLSASETGPAQDLLLGPDLGTGATPQIIVPENHWQSATTSGTYTLAGCTVSPAFRFEGFELAPPDFDIP